VNVKDHYATLGVDRQAPYEAIKLAWRDQAKRWHPDKFQTEDEKFVAHQRFVDLLEAYTVLIDEIKRAVYDRTLNLEIAAAERYSGYENANAAQDQKEAFDWFQSILDESPGEFAQTTIIFLLMSPIMVMICLFAPLLALGVIVQILRGEMSGGQAVLMIFVTILFFGLAAVLMMILKDLYYRFKRIIRWIGWHRRIGRLFGGVFKRRKPGRTLSVK
jgi:DnaJ-domain-containing protein 1